MKSVDQANYSNSMWMMDRKYAILCISAFAFLVRILVSMHSYSGAGKPPMYGDYEAQRHWMEITLHTPVKEWYKNTTNNNLRYWGLDYPPLTAYQSYAHGLAINALDAPAVALHTSKGYETPYSKLLMRWTVLTSDAIIFLPAALWFLMTFFREKNDEDFAWAFAMIILQPCLIIIDHGHFQYNCISIGLTLAAIVAIISNRKLTACVLFSLALNHKQMSAYYAPAFFSYLFGKCLRSKHPLLEIAKLGIVVLGTFAVIWMPFLHSKEAITEVIARLAPLQRGIYEDYVANFWCATSLLIKWKQLFPIRVLSRITLGATLTACLPSMIQQILAPSKKGFLYALFNSSLAFYLFSYQVHEKSILLPLLPASLLALEEPTLFIWMTISAMFSMYPLLRRDELTICYISLMFLSVLLFHAPRESKPNTGMICRISESLSTLWYAMVYVYFVTMVVLHVLYVAVQPPDKYPYLFEAAITAFVFPQLVFFIVMMNLKQWNSCFAEQEEAFPKKKIN